MKKYVCCMDISLASFGYAIFEIENETLIEVGTIKTRQEDSLGKRLDKIARSILELNDKYKFFEVVKERIYISKFFKSSEQLLKVHGVIELILKDTPIFEYSPRTIKKIITGSGKSDKGAVMKFVEKKYPGRCTNEDESDAVACGMIHFLVRKNG